MTTLPRTQNDMILHHLKTVGPLTPQMALRKFQCMRLSGRIWDLRQQGHPIDTEWLRVPSGKHVARYSLER